MLDRLNITLLLNNESLNNRFNILFKKLRMNSNRSKTICSRFYRVAYCLIVLLNVKIIRFLL